ncbi:MAG TPA: hypothetical protein VGO18_11020 [Steroidobacteraceae bacterium]|jgi:hypothetical protein|nr:hypothetical protein [Steroidobacteraceae bacterium]
MLLERAELLIREGQEEAFSAAMKNEGVGMLASVAGVMSVALGRGVEIQPLRSGEQMKGLLLLVQLAP